MSPITREQAALLAAIAMVLLTGHSLFDNFVLLRESPALVAWGSVVPSFVWAIFFFAVYRNTSAAKTIAWIALVALFIEAAAAYLRYQQSVSYWTPFGNALSLQGWLLRLSWAAFLIAFALAPDHKRTRKIALVVAIVCAPSALSTTFDSWNSWIGLIIDGAPKEAFWRVVITPAVRTIYWLSQILFLWSTWGNPEPRDPADVISTRLTP